MENINITCADISESSDTVWEALCIWEDGEKAKAWKMVDELGEMDQAIFSDEIRRMNKKEMKRTREERDLELHYFKPGGRWKPSNAIRGFDYERAILTEQGC